MGAVRVLAYQFGSNACGCDPTFWQNRSTIILSCIEASRTVALDHACPNFIWFLCTIQGFGATIDWFVNRPSYYSMLREHFSRVNTFQKREGGMVPLARGFSLFLLLPAQCPLCPTHSERTTTGFIEHNYSSEMAASTMKGRATTQPSQKHASCSLAIAMRRDRQNQKHTILQTGPDSEGADGDPDSDYEI